MHITESVLAARRVAAPLVAITTADQWDLVGALVEALTPTEAQRGRGDAGIRLAWDASQGLRPLTAPTEAWLPGWLKQFDIDPYAMASLDGAAKAALRLPAGAIIFGVNAGRFIDRPVEATAVMNLRGPFKESRRMLVMLGASMDLPMELRGDVVVLHDALPEESYLADIVTSVGTAAATAATKAGKPAPPIPEGETLARVLDAVRGLPAFAAEQAIALAVRPGGMDVAEIWARKRAAVNAQRGLAMTMGGPTFDDIGGNAGVAKLARRLFAGSRPPRAILRIDEIEKAMAGASGPVADSSGVSQDALGAILRWMEDGGNDGLIAVGPPGCCKTMFSRAMGATHGVPTLELDLGALKGSLVGESEANIRAALSTVDAIGAGRTFVVATCNRLEALPPELRRRYRAGIWFFDLPSREERAAIWSIHRKAFGIAADQKVPVDVDWTGAEIRNCCDLASRLGCSLEEAAAYVVPVMRADPVSIMTLRGTAAGRFLSAGTGSVYTLPTEVDLTQHQGAADLVGDVVGLPARRGKRSVES